MTTVTAHQARRDFAQLIELAYYKNEQIKINRNNKPMARIVGEPLMQTMDKVINFLIKHKPALADTLAIMVDDNIYNSIEQSRKEWQKGKKIPIATALQ